MAKRTKTKTQQRTEGMTWVGDGTETIPGVPPRDLTQAEADQFRDLIQATHDNTGRVLYEVTTVEEEPEPAPEPEQTPEDGEEKE